MNDINKSEAVELLRNVLKELTTEIVRDQLSPAAAPRIVEAIRKAKNETVRQTLPPAFPVPETKNRATKAPDRQEVVSEDDSWADAAEKEPPVEQAVKIPKHASKPPKPATQPKSSPAGNNKRSVRVTVRGGEVTVETEAPLPKKKSSQIEG